MTATPAPVVRTVLLVDDEPQVLLAVARLLPVSWRVLSAASGAEAISLVEREAVDLVLSDFRMPGMTGTELATELRRRGFPGTTALITAEAEDSVVQDALRQGLVTDVVSKAWSPGCIREAVTRLLPGA